MKAECRITVTSKAKPASKQPEKPTGPEKPTTPEKPAESEKPAASRAVTRDTTVSEVVRDPAFGDFGRLLFPVDHAVSGELTLAGISNSSIYTWYSNIKAEKTVE